MSRDLIPQIVAEWRAQQPHYRLYNDYIAGRHRFPFASWKFLRHYRWMCNRARENLMPAAVAAFTDTIRIRSWGSRQGGEEGLDRLAAAVHRGAFISGDAYTITWPAPAGAPRAVLQDPAAIVPHVSDDDPDLLDWAARVWYDPATARARINIYTPTVCERWATRLPMRDQHGAPLRDIPDRPIGWAPYSSPGAPETIPHAFGAVPVIWWKRDAARQDAHGVSILDQIIPIQDELNYHVVTALIASERIALPIRYAIAEQASTLGQNQQVNFDPTRENILALAANAVGEFAGPDADKLIALQNAAEQKIARTTGIPPYVFSQQQGDIPSGEALRILNARRTATVQAFEAEATPCWRGQLALLGWEDDVAPVWEDPTPHDDTERLVAARAAKDLGLPAEDWLRIAGYDPHAVDDSGATLADRVRDEAARTAQAAAQAFLDGRTADTGY